MQITKKFWMVYTDNFFFNIKKNNIIVGYFFRRVLYSSLYSLLYYIHLLILYL